MALTVTTPADLDRHLDRLGVRPGDDVLVHARLLSFGVVDGGAESVYAALRRAVGDRGTVAVPTYTLSLGPEDVYDPAVTPPYAVGNLSDHLRRRADAVRSLCPLHNHAAVGPRAGELLRSDGSVSFGEGSDFAFLRAAGFAAVLLGCGFRDGGTFTVHVEALAAAPFRAWRVLPRRIRRPNGSVAAVGCRYYARRAADIVEDFDRVEARLERAGVMTTVAAPAGASRRLSLADYEAVLLSAFTEDPYFTVVSGGPPQERPNSSGGPTY